MRKILVIGGGLAGLYAAWAAALHGADVELYEKGIIGSKHNCGEMFTEVYNSAPEECKLNKIKVFKFIIGKEVVNINFGENTPFVMTDRCKHELIIKERCKDLGVVIKEKQRPSEHSGRKEIDATGTLVYELHMGKAVDYVVEGMRNIKLFGELDTSDSSVAIMAVRDDLMGYRWFFPKGDNLCNIGDGVYDYKYKSDFEVPKQIDKSSILFKGGGLIPMPTMNEFYYKMTNNTKIQVGNAAGLVNPILGGGEHLAVLSGMLAGELVAKGDENRYYEALMDIIGDEMRIGISGYELIKNLDMKSISELLNLRIVNQLDFLSINNRLREKMKRWIHIPEVTDNEIEKFVGE